MVPDSEETKVLRLSMAGADSLIAALESPPKACLKLLEAARCHAEITDQLLVKS